MSDLDPIRLRRSPLCWQIYARRGWYRAVPFFAIEDACRNLDDQKRERRLGVTRNPYDRYPWVAGERATRGEGWETTGADAA
jgi:hypothetical protein